MIEAEMVVIELLKGATNQGMLAPLETRKGKEGPSLEPSETELPHLIADL